MLHLGEAVIELTGLRKEYRRFRRPPVSSYPGSDP